MTPITISILGVPQTAGSKRGFPMARKGEPIVKNGKFNGRVIIVDANPKGRDWKNRIAQEASLVMAGKPLLHGPLEVSFVFKMPRIVGHYRTNGELKPTAPNRPIVRPDALKLARAAEDALTGVVWRDDSQIVLEHLEKVYADQPGATITITLLEPVAPKPKDSKQPELVNDWQDAAKQYCP